MATRFKNKHLIALCVCGYLFTVGLTLIFPFSSWAVASPVAVIRGITIGLFLGILTWRH